jgi:hypothetical protein
MTNIFSLKSCIIEAGVIIWFEIKQIQQIDMVIAIKKKAMAIGSIEFEKVPQF